MNNETMIYQEGTEAIVISDNEVGFFKGEHVKYIKTRLGDNGFKWHLFENQHGYAFELTDEEVLLKGEPITWRVEYIPHKEKEIKTFTVPASIIEDAVTKLRSIEPRAEVVKAEKAL